MDGLTEQVDVLGIGSWPDDDGGPIGGYVDGLLDGVEGEVEEPFSWGLLTEGSPGLGSPGASSST